MLDESSMSSISSTDTYATSVYDDGLFIQLPASPKTETLMAENLNDLSNFGLWENIFYSNKADLVENRWKEFMKI